MPNNKWKLPYINQNLLTLIVGLIGLGFSELHELKALFWFSLIFSIIMGISVLKTMYRYTKNYKNPDNY